MKMFGKLCAESELTLQCSGSPLEPGTMWCVRTFSALINIAIDTDKQAHKAAHE